MEDSGKDEEWAQLAMQWGRGTVRSWRRAKNKNARGNQATVGGVEDTGRFGHVRLQLQLPHHTLCHILRAQVSTLIKPLPSSSMVLKTPVASTYISAWSFEPVWIKLGIQQQ